MGANFLVKRERSLINDIPGLDLCDAFLFCNRFRNSIGRDGRYAVRLFAYANRPVCGIQLLFKKIKTETFYKLIGIIFQYAFFHKSAFSLGSVWCYVVLFARNYHLVNVCERILPIPILLQGFTAVAVFFLSTISPIPLGCSNLCLPGFKPPFSMVSSFFSMLFQFQAWPSSILSFQWGFNLQFC